MPDCVLAPVDCVIMPDGTVPLFRATDGSGNPTLVTDVSDNNDVQRIVIGNRPTGPGGTFTLAYTGPGGSGTTAPIPTIPSPPAAHFTWNASVASGGTFDLQVNVAEGGTQSSHVQYLIRDDTMLLGAVVLDHHSPSNNGPPAVIDNTLQQRGYGSGNGFPITRWSIGRYTFATGILSVEASCTAGETLDADDLWIITIPGLATVRLQPQIPPATYGTVDPYQDSSTGYQPLTDTYNMFSTTGSGTTTRYLVDPAVVRSALTALPAIGANNVLVTGDGSSLRPLAIKFVGALGNASQSLLVPSDPVNVTVTKVVTGGSLPILHVTRGPITFGGPMGSSFDLPLRSEWKFYDQPAIDGHNNAPTMPTVRFILPQYLPAEFKYSRLFQHDNTLSGRWITYQDGGPVGGLTGFTDQVRNATGIGPSANFYYWLTPPNQYRVSLTWPPHPALSADVVFTVHDVDGNILGTYHVNQTLAPSGAVDQGVPWQVLGTYTLGPSAATGHMNGLVVVQTNNTSGVMIADTVRFEMVGVDDSVQIHPTDRVTYSAGAAWMTTLYGPAPAASGVPMRNCSGGTYYDPALLTLPTTMEIGYNISVPTNINHSIYSNIATLCNQIETYPTQAPFPSYNVQIFSSATCVGGDRKNPPNVLAGDYDIWWKGQSNLTDPSNGIYNGFQEDMTRVIYPAYDSSGYHRRTVHLAAGAFNHGTELTSLTIHASSSLGVGNWAYDFSDIRILPKDTNVLTAPKLDATFMANITPTQTNRFLDPLGAIEGNGGNFADYNKPQGNLNRNVVPTTVVIDLAGSRIEQYTGTETPAADTDFRNTCFIQFTFARPHGLLMGQLFLLQNLGGTINLPLQGTDPDPRAANPVTNYYYLGDRPLFAYPLNDPAKLVARIDGPPVFQKFYNGVPGDPFRMVGVVTDLTGQLVMRAGSTFPLQDIVEMMNQAGSNMFHNTHFANTQACVTSTGAFYANNLTPGRTCRVECSNEVWNNGLSPYAWATTGSAVFGYASSGDQFVPYYCETAHNHFGWFRNGWIGAGRDPSQLRFVMGSQMFNPGYTSLIAQYMHAKGFTCHDLVVANYFENAPSSTTNYVPQWPFTNAIYGATVGQQMDLLEDYTVNGRYEQEIPLQVDSMTGKRVNPDRTITYDRPEFLSVRPGLYEGGPDLLLVNTFANSDHSPPFFIPNYGYKQHGMQRHPRLFGITQLRYKIAQDSGCTFAHLFQYLGADRYPGVEGWPAVRAMGQLAYVPGNPAQDSIQINQVDRVDLQQSVSAGAIKAFASRYHAATSVPTTVTLSGPATGPVGSASTAFTVTLNAPAPPGGQYVTLADSSSANTFLGASVSGTTLTIPNGSSSGTFLYTRGSAGTSNISISSAGLTVFGSPVVYVASAAQPGTLSVIGRAIAPRWFRFN